MLTTAKNSSKIIVFVVRISMSARPFKQLLMKVGTETSEALHTYLIEFEEACSPRVSMRAFSIYIDRNEKYKRYIQLGEIHRDMALHQFLAFYEIDFTTFNLPLQFDHFFEITNEVIEAIGFSKSKKHVRKM